VGAVVVELIVDCGKLSTSYNFYAKNVQKLSDLVEV